MKSIALLLLGSLLVAYSPQDARCATISLTATEDTSIFQVAPNNNLGRNQSLASGGTARNGPARAMIRFDLEGQLPPGAIVTSAELELTVVQAPPSAAASTFGVHRLLRDWGEGIGGAGLVEGTGRTAVSGEATWISRFHTIALWDTAGGRSGVDFTPAASATAPVNTSSSATPIFESTPALVADIQLWLDDSASNFGWMLISQGEGTIRTARRFGSREHPTTSARPRLTINYELLKIENIELADNQFRFSFLAESDRNYKVEHRSQAGLGDWATLTNIGPLDVSGMVTVSDDVLEPARFYRVKKLPYFLLQPQPVVVAPGGTAQFTVSVAGGENLTYQWQWNGEDIPGATESTLTVPDVGESDLGDYRVVVTSGSDAIISQSASLMLLIAPFIVEPLQNQTNVAGSTVTFTVTVTNTATLPIGYRWRKGAQNVSIQVLNARTSSFSITNIQASDTANYSVIVTNAANISPGFISMARLEVEAP